MAGAVTVSNPAVMACNSVLLIVIVPVAAPRPIVLFATLPVMLVPAVPLLTVPLVPKFKFLAVIATGALFVARATLLTVNEFVVDAVNPLTKVDELFWNVIAPDVPAVAVSVTGPAIFAVLIAEILSTTMEPVDPATVLPAVNVKLVAVIFCISVPLKLRSAVAFPRPILPRVVIDVAAAPLFNVLFNVASTTVMLKAPVLVTGLFTVKLPLALLSLSAFKVSAPVLLKLVLTTRPLLALKVSAPVAVIRESSEVLIFMLPPAVSPIPKLPPPLAVMTNAPEPLLIVPVEFKFTSRALTVMALLLELILPPSRTLKVPNVPRPLFALKVKAPVAEYVPPTLMPLLVVKVWAPVSVIRPKVVLSKTVVPVVPLPRPKVVPTPFSVSENAPVPLAREPGNVTLFAVIASALLFELILPPFATFKAPKVAPPLFAFSVIAPFVPRLAVTLIPLLAVYDCAPVAVICDNNAVLIAMLVPAPFKVNENAPVPLLSVPGNIRLLAVTLSALLFELILAPFATVNVPNVAIPLFALSVTAPLVLILLVTLMPLLVEYDCAPVAVICDSSALLIPSVVPTPFKVSENAPVPLFNVPGSVKLLAVILSALLFELILTPFATFNVPNVAAPLFALSVTAPLVLILLVTLIPLLVV